MADCYVPESSLRNQAISLFDLAYNRPLRAHIANQPFSFSHIATQVHVAACLQMVRPKVFILRRFRVAGPLEVCFDDTLQSLQIVHPTESQALHGG